MSHDHAAMDHGAMGNMPMGGMDHGAMGGMTGMGAMDGMAMDLNDYDWDAYRYDKLSAEEIARLEGAFGAFFASRSMRELYTQALERRILLAPCNDAREMLEQAQLRDRQLFVRLDYPHLGASIEHPDFFAKVRNGLQIFPGGVPLYRGGTLVGGVGVSGDGVDQDDMIAFLGVHNAAARLGSGLGNAPSDRRADRLTPQGTRLRFVQCPQAPFLGSDEQGPCAGK